MHAVSQTYKTLRQEKGSYYEIKVVRGETEYTIADIRSLTISMSLFTDSGPQIGKVNSAQCELVVMESSDNWPRMAPFEIYLRLSSADDETKSEWISYGTYYTDERSEDDFGNLKIVAFDGVLLLETSWTDKINPPAEWPITSQAFLDLVEDAGLIEVDPRSVIDDTIAFIGLNTASTIRDVLKSIASAHGGNWQMTGEGKMRLIPFSNMSDGDAAIAGLAIAGISVVGTSETGIAEGAEYVYLGMKMQDFSKGVPLLGVSGIHFENSEGVVTETGTSNGYVVFAECEYASSEGLPELALSRMQDYVYKPFDSGVAYLDPAAEIGDLIIVNGRSYQMMTVDWDMGKFPAATLSAPFDAEIDHEYTVVSEEAKTYKKLTQSQAEMERRLFTRISQVPNEVVIEVGEIYQTKDAARIDKEYLEGEITEQIDDLNEMKMHYRFTDDGEIIGKTSSDKNVKLSNEGIDMMVNGESVTHWTQDEMLSPRRVKIPLSGTLQLGNFILQPRSNGNTSLLWVGE